MMKSNKGTHGFGYADSPQWGLFNPAQSLFKSDPTLYDSLFATNYDAQRGKDQTASKPHNRYSPGLPTQVGPRKAWKRSNVPSLYSPKGTNPNKGLTSQGGLDGFGDSIKSLKPVTKLILLVGALLVMKHFGGNNG